MKLSFKILLLPITLIILSGCSEAASNDGIPADVVATVISRVYTMPIKASFDIRLNKRVSKLTLKNLAKKITRFIDNNNYKRIYINYYLEGMQVNSGAWATTHYDPNLKVIILGSTPEEYKRNTTREKSNLNHQVVGEWFFQGGYTARKVTIYKEKNTTYSKSKFKDGSVLLKVVKLIKSKGVTRVIFNEPNGGSDYYIINKVGELEAWDEDGFFDKAHLIINKK